MRILVGLNYNSDGKPIPPEELAQLAETCHKANLCCNANFPPDYSQALKKQTMMDDNNFSEVSLSDTDVKLCEIRKRNSLSACSSNSVRSAITKKISILVSAKKFLLVVPHRDSLGELVISEGLVAKKKVPDLIESFKNKATMFFEKAKSFELKADGTLREYRETFNQFFAEDQLRLFGLSVTFEYALTKLVDDLILDLHFGAKKCELIEILQPSSIKESSSKELFYTDILCFPESEGDGKDIDALDLKCTVRRLEEKKVNFFAQDQLLYFLI
ncbi:unnamed protein product [Enterobius vermicularis]|uniref:Uncharacterized protein n=1 Tax=Enterobius vermicularis TaxID=51028 RepID=A0A3P6HBE8_ENTVE|nr:unnamed protein product [Enterobius vermicularis]